MRLERHQQVVLVKLLERIVRHTLDAERAYLGSLGGKYRLAAETGPAEGLLVFRQAVLDTLASAARGEIPAVGPRGGLRSNPRTFVRRAAWHLLDHAWEIEDRAES